MTFEELKAYLFALRAFGSRLGLERMRGFCEALGHPEGAVPMVHVAGTNGKGSVCALVDSALRAAGYRTGLFTSPHLVYLGERIQVDREPIAPGELTALVESIKPAADALAKENPERAPTFFEFMTGAAFVHFAREKVDVAVIETGLGGRFDSSNVILPRVSAVSSIGFDHMEYLGDTLEKIAFEKAGIFKKGVPVVLGVTPPEAESELRRVARAVGAGPILSVRERFGSSCHPWPMCALSGEHQRKNAATAALILETLRPAFPRLTPESVQRGFNTVQWAGRWQTIPLADGRDLILEGSHNPEGAQILEAELRVLAQKKPDFTAVCGVCGETRARAILPVLARHARQIILVPVDEPRACAVELMQSILSECGYRGTCAFGRVADLFPSSGVCRAGAPQETVLVTGSLYLVGEVLGRVAPPRWSAEGLGFQDLLPPASDSPRRP